MTIDFFFFLILDKVIIYLRKKSVELNFDLWRCSSSSSGVCSDIGATSGLFELLLHIYMPAVGAILN